MDFAVLVMAGGFVTVMIIVALRIDHIEYMERLRRKKGPKDDSAA